MQANYYDPFNDSFNVRDDKATLIIIFNKIAIFGTLPVQLLLAYKYFHFGCQSSDLMYLVYALTEFYFSVINFAFICYRSSFKTKFVKLRVISFFIPLVFSIIINTLAFAYAVYLMVNSSAVVDEAFG